MSGGIGPLYVGRSLLRREDRRLLTGQGQFIADLVLPHMLHAVLVRSPMAHARIRSVDLSRAATAPGVALALNGADLLQLLPPVPEGQISLPRKWTSVIQHKFLNPQQPLLAHDKVRHVGEAIAVIVAESRDQAEDAAELANLDLEELPAVVDPEAALRPDSPIVHDRFQTNLIGAFSVGRGEVEAVMVGASHRLHRRFYHHRYAAVPLECRGVVSAYDPRTDSATIWSSTQVVHWVRREAASLLGLPEARVRCVALDVGGGFGGKGHVYPEDLLVTFLARKLGRPVRWIEGRSEHLMSATHSRDQLHDVEVGFDGDGHILALRDDYIVDCGAWNPIGSGVAYNTAVHLTGPYKIVNLAASGRIVVTNKVPNAPYRGAGRPEAAFAMERTIDLVARTLGLEPTEVRRRNMIRADEMPYSVGISYRDGEPIVYDSGDYPAALQKALDAVGGVEAFRRRQSEARKAGRHLGLGIGCYIEGTGVGPFESAFVRIDPSGKIYVSSGVCPQGQGMETIFSQVAADLWKVAPGRRRDLPRRHGGDRDRVWHNGEPQHRNGVGGYAPRERAAPGQGLRHRRQSAGMCASRSRIAQWRRGHSRDSRRGRRRHGEPFQDRPGRAAGLGQRTPAGGRSRPRGDLLLAAANGHLELCRARRDCRCRPRDRTRGHRGLRRRA
jgi:carbon-monoxide dehydrogenase large subunit